MIWFFKKKEVNSADSDSAITHAFTHVKNDIYHVFNWLKYFHSKHNSHDERLAKIEQRIESLEKSETKSSGIDDTSYSKVQDLIRYHYSYESLWQKVRAINDKLDKLEKSSQSNHSYPSRISIDPAEKISENPKCERLGIKARLMRKISKNSKDYTKSAILSMIKKYSTISGSSLREIIVDEQGLCSKSSFYRILSELESESEISSVQSGKEKTYSLIDSLEAKNKY